MYVKYVDLMSILCQSNMNTFSSHAGPLPSILVLFYAVLCISAAAESELELQMYSCTSAQSWKMICAWAILHSVLFGIHWFN